MLPELRWISGEEGQLFYVDTFTQSTKGELNVGAANKFDFLLQHFLTSLRTSIPSMATRRTKLCWCASATATLFPPTGPGSLRRTASAVYVSRRLFIRQHVPVH